MAWPMVWHPSSRTAVTGKTILFAVSSVTLISIQFHATKTTFEAKSGRSDQITKSGPDSGDRTQRGAWIANSDLATQRVGECLSSSRGVVALPVTARFEKYTLHTAHKNQFCKDH